MERLKIEVDIVNNTDIPNATATDIIIMIITAASTATELLLPLLLPLIKKIGVILGQNCVSLSGAALTSMIYFFKNLFYQKQSKYTMNVGIAQIRGALS